MIDALSQFREAIRATGLEPPDVIKLGKLQRFPGVGKRNGNTAAWCMLFDDGLGGCFGDWSWSVVGRHHAKKWAKRESVQTNFRDCERRPFQVHP